MKCNKAIQIPTTYSDTLNISSEAHVFPTVVIATPVILNATAIIFVVFIDSCPSSAPKKSVKSADVEVKTVVLATLVLASAEFDKYCSNEATRLLAGNREISDERKYY